MSSYTETEERCFCGGDWFRSMHGRKPLCESHWWEWRRRCYRRQLIAYPDLALDTGFFGKVCAAFGLRLPERAAPRFEQLALFQKESA